MRINISAEAVDQRAEETYAGASKPLSTPRSGERPHELSWWLSGERTEPIRTDRHAAAMALYLELARRAQPELAANSFPAIFDCAGGTRTARRRPDKGFVKAAWQARHVREAFVDGELVFELTQSGADFLRHASPRPVGSR